MNTEVQRTPRRDKKAFLSEQCKEIEENNRMGKTRGLFKKIRYQGNNSCKDGHNRGQKLYGIEAESIKKILQEYTEELYHKDIHDPGLGRESLNSDSVTTQTSVHSMKELWR